MPDKHTWITEKSLLWPPKVLILTYKVLGIIWLICWLLLFTMIIIINGFEDAIGFTSGFAILLPIFLVLGALAFLIYALVNGGKICLHYEMDNKQITYREIKGVKKEEAMKLLQAIGAIAAIASGSRAVGLHGLRAKTRVVSQIKYKNVKAIEANRSKQTIILREKVGKTTIHTDKADYDFILNYLAEQCKVQPTIN